MKPVMKPVIKARDAEVISPWLVTSTTQRQDPCSGPTMDSMNYQGCKKARHGTIVFKWNGDETR